MSYLWQAGSEPVQKQKPLPGLLQQQRKQGMTGMMHGAPSMAMGDGKPFFEEAAMSLLLQDKDLLKTIAPQAMALQKQQQALEKVVAIGTKMGEDMSYMAPLMDQLKQQRKEMERTILGKAQVPSKASKPKVTVTAPRITP